MSSTVLYELGVGEIGHVRNSWLGGMYVWNDVARRYFGMDGFPVFDRAEQQMVWNAYEHVLMPRHEIVVLMTTMDFAVVRQHNVVQVAAAFRQYFCEHPSSGFAQQEHILTSAVLQPDALVAWNQTSVSEFWGIKSWNDVTGDAIWYDPSVEDRHFDAYASALEVTGWVT